MILVSAAPPGSRVTPRSSKHSGPFGLRSNEESLLKLSAKLQSTQKLLEFVSKSSDNGKCICFRLSLSVIMCPGRRRLRPLSPLPLPPDAELRPHSQCASRRLLELIGQVALLSCYIYVTLVPLSCVGTLHVLRVFPGLCSSE